jgi:hypothetical protein
MKLSDYLPAEDAVALYKFAEDTEDKKRIKTVLKGALGMGVGTLAGRGAAHYADQLYRHYAGKPIPSKALLAAVPVLGGGLGLAYNLAHTAQQKELDRAGNQGTDNSGGRGVPAG